MSSIPGPNEVTIDDNIIPIDDNIILIDNDDEICSTEFNEGLQRAREKIFDLLRSPWKTTETTRILNFGPETMQYNFRKLFPDLDFSYEASRIIYRELKNKGWKCYYDCFSGGDGYGDTCEIKVCHPNPDLLTVKSYGQYRREMRNSLLLIAFLVLILISSMICCSIFRDEIRYMTHSGMTE